MMSDAAIENFLNKQPSIWEILEFVDTEAQRMVAEKKGRKKGTGKSPKN